MGRSKSKQKRKSIQLKRKRKSWLRRKLGPKPAVVHAHPEAKVEKAAPKKKAATQKATTA
ncbi:hypothetical protein KAR48_19100 [bacterium]|nr:hypothetical protein [bacterium]